MARDLPLDSGAMQRPFSDRVGGVPGAIALLSSNFCLLRDLEGVIHLEVPHRRLELGVPK